MRKYSDHRQKTDAEKGANGGRVDPRFTEEAQAERILGNILRHPAYRDDIPDPEKPLDAVGVRKYFEMAGILFRAGKLTTISRDLCEQAAIMHMEQVKLMEAGKRVPAYISKELKSILAQLQLMDNAKPTGASLQQSQRTNRFAGFGFAARASKAARLQAPADHRG